MKLTSDRVPVVIHDATLDRTTPCTGNVAARTFAQLRAECPSDILGTDGNFVQLAAGDRRRAPIPKLSEALALAKDMGARVNLEIKNLPTDPDFDTTSGYANTVIDAIEAARFPHSRLIVQSFWPPNLNVAKSRLPDVETSLLSTGSSPAFIDAARNAGYDWVSPQWPLTPDYIAKAHAAGLRIVPYTIDTRGRGGRRRPARRGRADHQRPAAGPAHRGRGGGAVAGHPAAAVEERLRGRAGRPQPRHHRGAAGRAATACACSRCS